jgi:hypothetical protein
MASLPLTDGNSSKDRKTLSPPSHLERDRLLLTDGDSEGADVTLALPVCDCDAVRESDCDELPDCEGDCEWDRDCDAVELRVVVRVREGVRVCVGVRSCVRLCVRLGVRVLVWECVPLVTWLGDSDCDGDCEAVPEPDGDWDAVWLDESLPEDDGLALTEELADAVRVCVRVRLLVCVEERVAVCVGLEERLSVAVCDWDAPRLIVWLGAGSWLGTADALIVLVIVGVWDWVTVCVGDEERVWLGDTVASESMNSTRSARINTSTWFRTGLCPDFIPGVNPRDKGADRVLNATSSRDR